MVTSRHRREVSSTFDLSIEVSRRGAARQLPRDAHDALELPRPCSCTGPRRWWHRGLLAEVDAAGELAHEHQVHPLDDLGPERRGAAQRRVHAHRAQVREAPELPRAGAGGPPPGAVWHPGPTTSGRRWHPAAPHPQRGRRQGWQRAAGRRPHRSQPRRRDVAAARSVCPKSAAMAARQRSASARTSGPMPSPGEHCDGGLQASAARRRRSAALLPG